MKRKIEKDESDPNYFGDINAEASLWVLIPKAFSAIALSAVLILLIFWLRFGEIPAFAFGFAAFIAVLQILIIVGLRFFNRKDVHAAKQVRNDLFDKVGAWWLVACAFGVFFGWICGNLAQSYPQWTFVFLAAEIVFLIVLPVVTLLPNLRYVSRNAAPIQIPIIVLVTSMPLVLGIGSLIALWNFQAR